MPHAVGRLDPISQTYKSLQLARRKIDSIQDPKLDRLIKKIGLLQIPRYVLTYTVVGTVFWKFILVKTTSESANSDLAVSIGSLVLLHVVEAYNQKLIQEAVALIDRHLCPS